MNCLGRLALLLTILTALAAPAAAQVKVVVTIKPLHALVAAVMRGVGIPAVLVRGSSSPHTYALKPSDASILNRADLFFRTSETLEPFTARVIESLPSSVKVITVLDAPGVRLLPWRIGPTFERDSHISDGKHEAGLKDGSRLVDGHAWLDPQNAKAMVAYIAMELSATDPANAATFKSNAETLERRLDDLTVELDRILKPVADRPYVVFHDALQYFERRFGLNVVGSISVSPEIPPSAKHLQQVRQRIKAIGALCVLAEPQFGSALISSVTEGTGARVGMIDPEGIRLAPDADLYFALLRTLAADLTRCLSQSA